MKNIKYLAFMLLAFVGVSSPLLAAENNSIAAEDKDAYLSALSNEQLVSKLSGFDDQGRSRVYAYAYEIDGSAIGYTEWCAYKDGITDEIRNSKKEFFTSDCTSFNTEETTISVGGSEYSATKTACIASSSITNIKATASEESIKFNIEEGFAPTKSFAMGINVNDEGNKGNLYINEDNSTHDFEYTLSDEAKDSKSDKNKDKKDDKSSKDKDSKSDKKSDKKKSNKDDSMSILTFCLIIGTAVSVILLIVLIIVYILRRKKLKRTRQAQPQIGQF